MALVAVERLRWGDGHIEPGDPVPDGEPGRDYDSLLRHGQIARVSGGVDVGSERDEALERAESAEASLKQALGQVETLTAERDELARQVEELTAPPAAGDAPPEPDLSPGGPHENTTMPAALPDGVAETSPGWFTLADGTKVHGRAALATALAAQGT